MVPDSITTDGKPRTHAPSVPTDLHLLRPSCMLTFLRASQQASPVLELCTDSYTTQEACTSAVFNTGSLNF